MEFWMQACVYGINIGLVIEGGKGIIGEPSWEVRVNCAANGAEILSPSQTCYVKLVNISPPA